MNRNTNTRTVKVVGWRIPADLVQIVHDVARREGRYVERVAADALRAGLPAVIDRNKPIE